MDSTELMKLAIAKAEEGIAQGQSPFGCAIALDGELLSTCHNTVLATIDITAHAEINALRAACRELGRYLLDGALVATTCEPCPMCMAALHWARVGSVYYGASIADAEVAGFNELSMPAAELLHVGGSSVRLVGDTLSGECRQLFARWQSSPAATTY